MASHGINIHTHASAIGHLTKFTEAIISANSLAPIKAVTLTGITFPKFTPISSFALNSTDTGISAVVAQLQANQESFRFAISSLRLALPQIQIELSRVGEVFQRINNDPVLKQRFELLTEKERLMYTVIDLLKPHLSLRIEHQPYEWFADQFEFACSALIDNARTNEELAAINDKNFIDVLKDIAARINLEIQRDNRRREKEQEQKLFLAPAPTEKSKRINTDEQVYITFEDLFINPADIKPCVGALRRIDPPLINENGAWIGRRGSKAKFSAFIRRLEDCRKIHFISDKKRLVPLVNAYIIGLNFGADARTMAAPDPNALTDFAALILP